MSTSNDNYPRGVRGDDIVIGETVLTTYTLPSGDILIPEEDIRMFFDPDTITAERVLALKIALQERMNVRS